MCDHFPEKVKSIHMLLQVIHHRNKGELWIICTDLLKKEMHECSIDNRSDLNSSDTVRAPALYFLVERENQLE